MISTHILDTHKGLPAEGVTVRLEKKNNNIWVPMDSGQTNSDGRLVYNVPPEAGVYQLHFEVESYYEKQKQKDFFFPLVTVSFIVNDLTRKYHVPLLLNPFGYTTYRGS